MASSTRLKVGTRQLQWALQPRVYFHEQLRALLTSSHPRCGRNSPASALPVSLIRQMAEMWRPGSVFVHSCSPTWATPSVAVIVGMSKRTLGVTTRDPIIKQMDLGNNVVWMTDDGSLCLRPVPAAVCDIVNGCEVPIPESGNLCTVKGRGQWIIDSVSSQWNMWRVVRTPVVQCGARTSDCEVDSKKGLLCVLGPRKLATCKECESATGLVHHTFFKSFVGDGSFFWVCCYAHHHHFIHLIDSARAFESGEIVPVDTVDMVKPVEWGVLGVSVYQCFWGSRRVLANTISCMYEMGGTPRELCLSQCCRAVTDTLFIAERQVGSNECCLWDFSGNSQEVKVFGIPCVCTGLTAVDDFVIVEESCSKVHLVDLASGVAILTLQLL
ncbi:hypothetical protein Pelo_17381 [Pelomyxa schiedti]|nr:hypothetical protein Pelo_17381 [Pelomyxa schiedti]